MLQCLPCDRCAAGTLGCVTKECEDDSDCPGPPDSRCGSARCINEMCTLHITAGKLDALRRGDCRSLECTRAGEVVEMPDLDDPYDDGNECTYDYCDGGEPRNTPFDRLMCPESGAGRCVAGQCVDCNSADPGLALCPGGRACIGTSCVPLHCQNSRADPGLGETGFDCGGPCLPCPVGSACASGSDCLDGVCAAGTCRLATCSDNVKNGAETGIDCGAAPCPLCEPGKGCRVGADCTSGVCWDGACEAPSCDDGVRNGAETGVDCGGGCPPCQP